MQFGFQTNRLVDSVVILREKVRLDKARIYILN